jgi:hypothetical protein
MKNDSIILSEIHHRMGYIVLEIVILKMKDGKPNINYHAIKSKCQY